MELDDAPRHTRDAWTRDNNLGLRWASEGRWFEAADAFARAVALATGDIHDEPTPFATVDLDHEEALAVLLTNLSQAQFEIGHLNEALESAERACAIRTSLMGDDAPAVARSRSQVAVMLGFMGRLEEAQSLIAQAIASLQGQLSDDDDQLAPLLENAARLALAAGQPAAAEPHLIRLHFVLAENGHSLAVVEELLALIAASRAAQASRDAQDIRDAHALQVEIEAAALLGQTPGTEAIETDAVATDAVATDALGIDATATEAVVTEGPPNDAMILTEAPAIEALATEPPDDELPQPHNDVAPQLLATELVPAEAFYGGSTAAMSGSHESVNVFDSIAVPIELAEHTASGDLEVLDLELELDEAKLMATATRAPEPEAPSAPAASEDIFGGASFDLVEPPPPTLNSLPQHAKATPSRANPLGFEVEYGVPQQPYEPTGLARPEVEMDSTPDLAEGQVEDEPIRGAEARVSPLDQPTPLVMPGQNESQWAPKSTSNQDTSSLRLTLHPADVDNPDDDTRRSRRARIGRTVVADPKKPWLIAVAIVLTGIAAGLLFSGVLSRS